ncbi:hypothetical protein CH063_15739, partial [Colletotrichum higginsianum]
APGSDFGLAGPFPPGSKRPSAAWASSRCELGHLIGSTRKAMARKQRQHAAVVSSRGAGRCLVLVLRVSRIRSVAHDWLLVLRIALDRATGVVKATALQVLYGRQPRIWQCVFLSWTSAQVHDMFRQLRQQETETTRGIKYGRSLALHVGSRGPKSKSPSAQRPLVDEQRNQ